MVQINVLSTAIYWTKHKGYTPSSTHYPPPFLSLFPSTVSCCMISTPVFPRKGCRSIRWPPWPRLSAAAFSGGRVSGYTHPSNQAFSSSSFSPPHFLLSLPWLTPLTFNFLLDPFFPSFFPLIFYLPSLVWPPIYCMLNLTIFMPSFFHHICNVLSLFLSSLRQTITCG